MFPPSRLDPDQVNIPDDAWELVEVSEDFVTHRAPLERFANGDVAFVYRKAPRALTAFLEANKRSFDESHGKRFGDGKVVASIPLNVLYDPKTQLAEKMREGDNDHMKWWLNSEAARPFRTFRGKV